MKPCESDVKLDVKMKQVNTKSKVQAANVSPDHNFLIPCTHLIYSKQNKHAIAAAASQPINNQVALGIVQDTKLQTSHSFSRKGLTSICLLVLCSWKKV